MSNKKLKYEKPQATNVGALSHVHGVGCESGFEDSLGCNSTGNYAAECGFGYNNGVQTICDSTGSSAENNCQANGASAGQGCVSDGGSPVWGCFAGSTA